MRFVTITDHNTVEGALRIAPDHCRRTAGLLGAEYRELELPGGHVWMLDRPRTLAALLRDSAR